MYMYVIDGLYLEVEVTCSVQLLALLMLEGIAMRIEMTSIIDVIYRCRMMY